jgi:hypothetical protein
VSFTLITPSPVVLRGDIYREPPRPIHLRQVCYHAEYDYTTLFYDIVLIGNTIRFIGPPLANLRQELDCDSFYLDAFSIPRERVRLSDANRTQNSYIDISGLNVCPSSNPLLSFNLAGLRYTAQIRPSLSQNLRARKCLLTLSKNNALRWIADWLTYYKRVHGIDVVVFYDNQSDAYSLDELQNVLVKECLDVDIYLIKWNFPYGPQGGVWAGHKSTPWDSDYCQYGMFEHAKHYLLNQAELVINHDIDELLLPVDGHSINEYMIAHGLSFVCYSGQWVSPTTNKYSNDVSFRDFVYTDTTTKTTTTKWVLKPFMFSNEDLQWKTHSVAPLAPPLDTNITHRHFKGISTNWKFKRQVVDKLAPIRPCKPLIRAFNSIGWSNPEATLPSFKTLLHASKLFFSNCADGKPTSIFLHSEATLVFDFRIGIYHFALDVNIFPDSSLGITAYGCDANSQKALDKLSLQCLRKVSDRFLLSLHDRSHMQGLFEAVYNHAKQLSRQLSRSTPSNEHTA